MIEYHLISVQNCGIKHEIGVCSQTALTGGESKKHYDLSILNFCRQEMTTIQDQKRLLKATS